MEAGLCCVELLLSDRQLRVVLKLKMRMQFRVVGIDFDRVQFIENRMLNFDAVAKGNDETALFAAGKQLFVFDVHFSRC